MTDPTYVASMEGLDILPKIAKKTPTVCSVDAGIIMNALMPSVGV